MQILRSTVTSWLCLIAIWAASAFLQSPDNEFGLRNGMYSVRISGVTYWGGANLPDGEMSNNTHPFIPQGGINNRPNGSNSLQFSPNHVNFSQQEMGMPAYADVTITNTSPNQSVHLISIQTSSFTLLFKPINVAVLEPRQATAISLLLVANKVGHIEAELYAETNIGLSRCKVYGYSTPSKYGIRPLKTRRLRHSGLHKFTFTFKNPNPFPVEVSQLTLSTSNKAMNGDNDPLFFSSVKSFSSQSIPNSITLVGQQSDCSFSISISNVTDGNIFGLISGLISLNVSSSGPSLPKSPSNFIFRNFSFEPTVFLVPLEVHSVTMSEFIVQEDVLDFGVLRHSDPPRQLHLTAFNKLTVPSSLNISTTSAASYLELAFDPVVFPDYSTQGKEIATVTFSPSLADRSCEFFGNIVVSVGSQPSVVIPYRASVLNGQLKFSPSQLSFFCGKKSSKSTAVVTLTNTFDFPLEVWGYRVPESFGDSFEIKGLKEVAQLNPSASANISIGLRENCKVEAVHNITVYTNASAFDIPVSVYFGQLKVSSLSSEDSDDNLDFGVVESQEKVIVYISNGNPVPIAIQRIQIVKRSSGIGCVNLTHLAQYSDLFCEYHDRLEYYGTEIAKANCDSKPFTVRPSSWIPLFLNLELRSNDDPTEWTITIETNFIPTSKRLTFRAVTTSGVAMSPSTLDLGPIFPGKSVSRGISVPNNLVDVDVLKALVTGAVDSASDFFHVELSRPAGKPLVINVSAFFSCRDIFEEDQEEGAWNSSLYPICHAGFSLETVQGKHWLSGAIFPFSSEAGLSSTSDFFAGLRFSANVFSRLQTAWRSLLHRQHTTLIGTNLSVVANTRSEYCPLFHNLHIGHLTSGLVWPRLLSDSVMSDTPDNCQLTYRFGGHTEGQAKLQIRDLENQPIACHLSLINRSGKPVAVQTILLDDLLPEAMSLKDMAKRFAEVSEELARAAHLPKHLVAFPQHPALRSGRFTIDIKADDYGVSEALKLVNTSVPACCPVRILQPNDEVTLSITFLPSGFFSSHSTEKEAFKVAKHDSSLLLLRNNLTSLESVYLHTVSQAAVLGVRSGLLPIEMSIPGPPLEGVVVMEHDRAVTNFPTATGLPVDSAAIYNPGLTNPACDNTPLAGSVDVARFDLRLATGNALCPVAATGAGGNLSLCRVPITLLNHSHQQQGSLFSFTFHEGHLRALCTDGAVRPRPSISRFLDGLRSSLPSFLLLTLPFSLPSPEKPRFSSADSPLQLAWTVDENGMPIFSSEFVSGLVLHRRIALVNPGTVPVWIMRVGFKQSGEEVATSKWPLGQCAPHLSGFHVALCDSSGSHSHHMTVDGALREFELKPGEERWLEVLYSPDFLHTEVTVQLCLFASLRAPSLGRPVWLSKRMIELEPASPPDCGNATAGECSVFQLETISLMAKISAPLARLCHGALLRPGFEGNLWSILLFLFASNLTGIFVLASFDSIRMLGFVVAIRSLYKAATTESDQMAQGRLFNLNFNLPYFGQMDQAPTPLSSPQITEEATHLRRRQQRISGQGSPRNSPVQTSTIVGAAMAIFSGIGSTTVWAAKSVMWNACKSVVRGASALGDQFSSLLSSVYGGTTIETTSAVATTPPSAGGRSVNRPAQKRPSKASNSFEGVGSAFRNRKSTSGEGAESTLATNTTKQTAVKASGDVSISSSTQASGDGASSPQTWSNLRSRIGSNAKHSSVADLHGSPKSPGGGSAALKKNSLPTSIALGGDPGSPKTRGSPRASQGGASQHQPSPPTPPPCPPPPAFVVMESIKAESASKGVKKPKQQQTQQQQHLQQQQQQQQVDHSSKSSPPSTSTLAKPSTGLKIVDPREATLSKQKLPVANASEAKTTAESPAQRKKSAKLPTTPRIVSPSTTLISAMSASSSSTASIWQSRKPLPPQGTTIEHTTSSSDVCSQPINTPFPPTITNPFKPEPSTKSPWTGSLPSSLMHPHSNMNNMGDLEFPPLGSVPPRRPLKIISPPPASETISETVAKHAAGSTENTTTSEAIVASSAPPAIPTTVNDTTVISVSSTSSAIPKLGALPMPLLTPGFTSCRKFVFTSDTSQRHMPETAELDRQPRYLHSNATSARCYHHSQTNWFDLTYLQQPTPPPPQHQQQCAYVPSVPSCYGTQNDVTACPSSLLPQGYGNNNTKHSLFHQPLLANGGLQYGGSGGGDGGFGSADASAGDLKVDFGGYSPQSSFNQFFFDSRPEVDDDSHFLRGHRRRCSSTGQILADERDVGIMNPSVALAPTGNFFDFENFSLFAPHSRKSDMDLSLIPPSHHYSNGNVIVEEVVGGDGDQKTEGEKEMVCVQKAPEDEADEGPFFSPEWINAFDDDDDDAPPPTHEQANETLVAPTPPCELEEFIANSQRWMLIHEARTKPNNHFTEAVTATTTVTEEGVLPTIEYEEFVPSNPLDQLTAQDTSFAAETSLPQRRGLEDGMHVDSTATAAASFDKTVGSQLNSGGAAGAEDEPIVATATALSPSPCGGQNLVSGDDKTWLPALLPWKRGLAADDPSRDPDFAEAALFQSYRSDIPGPFIQDPLTKDEQSSITSQGSNNRDQI